MAYELPRLNGVRVLVTGGAGFVGSNLSLKLRELGADVAVLDNLHPMYGATWANVEELRRAGVTVYVADVRDWEAVEEAFKRFKPDIVFHAAAQVSHIKSMSAPEGAWLDIDVNLKGTINILEAARRHADSARLVYIGTRGEYGDPKYLPIDEEHPEYPPDIYGVDKLAAGRYFFVYGRAYGMWFTYLRPTNLVGPRQRLLGFYGIVGWFIRLALEGKTITIYGDGSQTRDILYVEDAVDAMILAATSDKARGRVYNVSSGEEHTLREIAELIVRYAGSGRIEFKPYPPEWKRIEVKRVVLSPRRIMEELGWKPRTPLEEAIRRTVEWYRGRLHLYT